MWWRVKQDNKEASFTHKDVTRQRYLACNSRGLTKTMFFDLSEGWELYLNGLVTLESLYHHLYYDFKMVSVKLTSRVLAIKITDNCIVFDFLTVCCVIDNWYNHYHVNL